MNEHCCGNGVVRNMSLKAAELRLKLYLSSRQLVLVLAFVLAYQGGEKRNTNAKREGVGTSNEQSESVTCITSCRTIPINVS